MNVLILGSGGREHALARAVSASSKLGKLYCLPGNAGTADLGENLPGSLEDLPGLVETARRNNIDFTIVGPEVPLCAGVVDRFEQAGLRAFGPTRAAARIEGDKAYAKELMHRALVPTAEARVFTRHSAARTYAATRDCALVVKAAGLAAGKGVIICDEPSQALLALERIMIHKEFGPAGDTVLVEERLEGPELSIFALVDGCTIYVLDAARDFKKAGEGDTGPNTGGMGAVSPVPGVDAALLDRIQSDVLVPIVDALRGDGAPYQGLLYAGLMLTPAGPKVLEFNCRFGDPETQVVLPRIRSDVLDLLVACTEGRLADEHIEWDPRTAVCVVLAAGGYPGPYAKGKAISGLDAAAAEPDAVIFHGGTARVGNSVVTAGGRVLNVVGLGHDVAAARTRALEVAQLIQFDNVYLRRDIARQEAEMGSAAGRRRPAPAADHPCETEVTP